MSTYNAFKSYNLFTMAINTKHNFFHCFLSVEIFITQQNINTNTVSKNLRITTEFKTETFGTGFPLDIQIFTMENNQSVLAYIRYLTFLFVDFVIMFVRLPIDIRFFSIQFY